jgi:hypothetical protein
MSLIIRQFVGTLSGNPHPVRRRWLPAYAITIEAVTTILLAIRLASRFKKLGGRPGFDDVFVFLGWAAGLAVTILASICMNQSQKPSNVICSSLF